MGGDKIDLDAEAVYIPNTPSVNTTTTSSPVSATTTIATKYRGLPSDWVHVSFCNLDDRQLDLYLLVEANVDTSRPIDAMSFSIR